MCAGWKVKWDNPIAGVKELWLNPGNSYCIRVRVDSTPFRIDGSDGSCNEINKQSEVRDISCSTPSPL